MSNETPPDDKNTDKLPWDLMGWWLTLVVAVIAIPALAFIVVTITGVDDIIGLMVFMVCCWTSSYFGIQLMKHPNMHKKRDFTRD
jgi:hypothetical protein